MDSHDEIDAALVGLREAADDLPREAHETDTSATDALPPIRELDEDERERWAERAASLGEWQQGPFQLAPGLVAGAGHDDAHRWRDLDRRLGNEVAGRRALAVGCLSGYDCFALAARGATDVVGCEWTRAVEQAQLLEELYSSGVRFERAGWDELSPERLGTFDFVHCDRVLERTAAPMNLLARLWRMTTPGGVLLFGAVLLDDPAMSRFAAFEPGRAPGSPPAWRPGRLTLRWMVETSGFDPTGWLGDLPDPDARQSAVHAYLRAERSERIPAAG